ncbi:MAG: prepilin peptidase [Lachnospiraceae bacterium]|nr:prepilin peptidase [Lachnospiraceae bacterium]
MFGVWWLVVGILIFAVLSVFDIKSRRIPICGFVIVFVYSVLSLVCFKENDLVWSEVLMSAIPGLVLMGLSVITEGKIGLGDGILVAEIGLALGIEKCAYMLTGALILSCLFSGGLLAFRKAGLHTRIPFVPFITAGMGVIAFVFA